jgi:Domain of unknown function (DUF4340)
VSPRKLIVLTAIVVVLFTVIFVWERKMPSTADRQRKGELYWDLPEDRVTQLTVTREGETLEFRRTADAPWRMVQPSPYAADTFSVNGLVSDLADLRRAGSESGEAKPEAFGLDKPVATATLVWTDADEPETRKTRTIEFGSGVPGTDMTAARVSGQTRVLFIPSSVLTSVRKSTDDFRSKELFAGPAADVTRLEISRGQGSFVLARREGVWWISQPFSDLADAAAANRLVSELTALRAREFVHSNEDLAALSLQPPLYRVSLTGDKGVVTSVDFGATRSDGDTVYARREGQVLTVERDIVDELSKESEPFRSTSLVSFDRSEVVSVDARFGDATYAFKQESGGWSASGRPLLAPAADDVLQALADMKSRAFVDEASAKALDPATATFAIKAKPGGTAWNVAFHPRATDVVARVSGRPGGFVVSKDNVSFLQAAFQKAVAPPTPAPTKKK